MLAAALLSGGSQFVVAQTAESSESLGEVQRIRLDEAERPLALVDVVLLAFERNLDIDIRRLDEAISRSRTMQEQGVYDPELAATARYDYSELQSAQGGVGADGERRDALSVNERESVRGDVRLNQLLPTGATAYVGAASGRSAILDSRRRTATLDPEVDSRVFIGIRQPLLRNFGSSSTNLGIRLAEKQEAISALNYQQEVLNQLAAVMGSYWDVVFAIRNLEVQVTSLEAAAELERVNRVKVDTGALARADLLRASAQVADRRNRVIRAKSEIVNAQDRLLQLLNWAESGNTWDSPIVPTDRPDKYDLDLELDDRVAVGTALATRPDYSAASVAVESTELSRDVARRDRLPQLDAFAEVGSNGLDDNHRDSFSDTGSGDYLDAAVGLDFRYPLLNRRARGVYRQRTLEAERAGRVLVQAEQRVLTEVRFATRSVRTAQESIEASIAQVESARETLTAEQRRLEVGSSTTFQVLDAQQDLATAEVNLINAQVNYMKGMIDLHRSQGTLLEQLGQELGVELRFEE